jgi:hypothetical protein
MKIIRITSHKYAPELNTATLRNGATISVPGLTTIREVRRMFAPVRAGRYAVIVYTHPEHPCLDDRITGYITSRYQVLTAIEERRSRHNVVGGRYDVSIKLIG